MLRQRQVEPTSTTADPDEQAPGRVRSLPARLLGLVLLLGVVVFLAMLSFAVGAKPIPLGTVVDAVLRYDYLIDDHLLIVEARLPRTLAALVVGVALGLAGAVMQGLTRNPLADPGLLGVSAGASFAVVIGLYVVGFTSPLGYVWFSFAGAAVASIAVYVLGAVGPGGAAPVRLALAGAALSALLGSLTTAVLLVDVGTLDRYRFWAVGAVTGVELSTLAQLAPFVVLGAVLALAAGPMLNALALGDDLARALGARIGATRALCAVAVVLLVGAATAIAGPIGFVGLTVPHVARAIVGPDYRWILAYSAVLAPALLLASDVLGRVIARPGEIQVGIVTAVVGAPFFVLLVRRRNLAQA